MSNFIHEIFARAPLIIALISFPAGYLSVAGWECDRAKRKAAAKRRKGGVQQHARVIL